MQTPCLLLKPNFQNKLVKMDLGEGEGGTEERLTEQVQTEQFRQHCQPLALYLLVMGK